MLNKLNPSSLRIRLMLVVLIAGLPASLLVVDAGIHQRKLARRLAEEKTMAVAREIAARQEQLIEGARHLLLSLSHQPILAHGSNAERSGMFMRMLKEFPVYTNIGMIAMDGNCIGSGVPLKEPVNLADRPYFQRALETGEFAVGEFQVGKITGLTSINMARLVVDESGAKFGVVFAALGLEWLHNVAYEAKLPPDSVLTVFDSNAKILARLPGGMEMVGRTLPEAEKIKAEASRREENTMIRVGVDNVARLYATAPILKIGKTVPAYVSVGMPLRSVYEEANNDLLRNLVVLAAATSVALGASWLIGRRLIELPIRRLAMATRDLAAGNLSARVSFSGRHDEISSLGQAFDEMAEAIEDQTNERERAEAALRESEERLRMALSARQMGTFRMDMTRRVVFMDERLRELHGFPPDKVEVGLEEAMERIHPDDRALMIATIEQTARDEPAKQLEFRVILPDGSIRWLAGWGRLLGSHAPGQIVGVHYDITTRKEAVEKLRVNEDRLRLALHASQAGVWERNLRTREEVWSPENFDLYGLDPSKGMLSNHDWERLLHPDDLAGARKAYDDIIAGRAAEFHWEFRINHPVRGQRWLLGLGRVFRNKAGMAESLIGINLDITERKQREVEQAALAAIVENSADAIVGMTLDGFITSWNRGAEQLFGYAASEVIGRHISLILPAERMHDYEVVMGRIRKGEKIAHFESVRRTKDGRMIDVSLTVSPIRNAHGDVVGLSKIAHDISVRKHSEEKLREAKDAAEAANRLKGEFLANMSHEIRTPMHALIGMLDLLIREELSSDRRTSLEMAKSSASSLLRLLEEILALSKIEAGQAQVRCVEFSLDACLRDSVGTLAGLATSRGLALDWKVASGIPDLLNGDDIRLGQVLSNLVNNAIKFTRQGGVEVVVNRTGGTDQEIELHFAVRDTGIGIPAASLQRIFEAFIQVDASSTREYGGVGLGLAITRRLVDSMGGRIWVESEPGRGSTFYFTVTFGVTSHHGAS